MKITVTPIHGGTPIINDKAALNLQVGDGSDGTRGEVAYGEGAAPYAGGETSTAGDYLYLWKVTFAGGQVQSFPNDGYRLLTITADAPTTAGRYVTREELKKTLQLTGESYADSDIDVAIEAASRALELSYNNNAPWALGTPGEIRYYTAYNDREAILGDVMAITSIGVDIGPAPGGGTYNSPLVAANYRLLPIQNGLIASGGNGEPYRTLQLARGFAGFCLPTDTDTLKITGTFGWEHIPAGVRIAATIIATRILKRARDNPTGFATLGVDGEAIRALSFANDPEIQFAMTTATPPQKVTTA